MILRENFFHDFGGAGIGRRLKPSLRAKAHATSSEKRG
jgi:hypothetical protein